MSFFETSPGSCLHVAEGWRDVIAWRTLADALNDPAVKVWRDVTERTNGVLDTPRGRVHVKRIRAGSGERAEDEVNGLRLLAEAGIPSPELVAWGSEPPVVPGVVKQSMVAVADLAGYSSADQRPIDEVLAPAATLAARLHAAGLHHRDLYLCHVFSDGHDYRLIDAARVRRLPRLSRLRWVVKDVAQLVYSTPATHRDAMLRAYAADSSYPLWLLRPLVARKVAAIARHDAKLKHRQPGRDVTLTD